MRTGMIVLISTLLLSGCGGGSYAPPVTSPATNVRAADPDASAGAAEKAATNLPAFGSVTQSSNAGSVAGVTGDAASTAFDGSHVQVTIDRVDGSSLQLDSESDEIVGVDYQPVLAEYSYRGHGLVKQSDEGTSLAAVYVNSNDADSSDYLAGGYWLHVEGDLASGDVAGAEIGAFVDGPEIDGPADVPVSGSASYVGTAAGFYAYQSASSEIGEFSGDLEMTANFDRGTVSGCVGCKTGVFVSGVSVNANGQAGVFEDVYIPARWRMGAAQIGQDGSFRDSNVEFERDDATVASTDGSWGGRFSTIGDDQGPRLAAGTGGASWTEVGGAQGAFVGAWFGVRQPN